MNGPFPPVSSSDTSATGPAGRSGAGVPTDPTDPVVVLEHDVPMMASNAPASATDLTRREPRPGAPCRWWHDVLCTSLTDTQRSCP